MKKLSAFVLALLVGGLFLAANQNALSWNGQTNDIGSAVESFYGDHQAGIETERQAHATYVALNLVEGSDVDSVGRMMRVLTSDAGLLTQGKPLLTDSQAEMAQNPARLTIAFGFGHSLFSKIGQEELWPIPETKIPHYAIDKLEGTWDGGDLVIQVSGDDPNSVFHAVHELVRDVEPFTTIAWQQRGFVNAAGVNKDEISRNLLGQIDGTANAEIGSPEFEERTWVTSGPLAGGTTMVVRRIRMNFGEWDRLSRHNKDEALGRKLEDGAPLSGGDVNAPMDFSAQNSEGEAAIPDDAHAKRAFTTNNQGITRRGWNYDDGYLAGGIHDAGLVFISYQSDLQRYLKIQALLAEMDALNKWTTPVGSALFVMPGGVQEGEWIGQEIFSNAN